MVGIDVGHHRHVGLQRQERGIAFIGLGHEILAATQARVGAGAVEPPADDEGRVEPALGETTRHQTGGRGLAVRAGDGDAALQAHELAQHLGAWDHRNARGVRGGDLGVGFRHRRGDYHHVRTLHERGVVTDHDFDAESLQALRGRRCAQVGSAYVEFQVVQHLGDAAHAGATDADEMHTPYPRAKCASAAALNLYVRVRHATNHGCRLLTLRGKSRPPPRPRPAWRRRAPPTPS